MKIKVNDWQWDELKEQHRKDQMMIDWLGRHLKQYADAAEFEARVSEWLTYDEVQDYTRDPCANGCQFAYDDLEDCPHEREWCRLKMARLAVEKEMDG